MDYAQHEAPRILFLDIETRPAIVASFGIRDQHIGHKQILRDGGIICVGLRWSNEKRAKVYSDWQHGHRQMLETVHSALCQADAVATYNGGILRPSQAPGRISARRTSPSASSHTD